MGGERKAKQRGERVPAGGRVKGTMDNKKEVEGENIKKGEQRCSNR